MFEINNCSSYSDRPEVFDINNCPLLWSFSFLVSCRIRVLPQSSEQELMCSIKQALMNSGREYWDEFTKVRHGFCCVLCKCFILLVRASTG